MYRVWLLQAALVLAAAAGAAEPPVTFPTTPVVPAPAPPPSTIPVLVPGTWYVINSKVDAFTDAYPEGLVKITKEAGPVTIKGVFVDGTGAVETRKYPGPYVFYVEPIGTAAPGRVTLVVTPVNALLKSSADLFKAVIDVNSGQAPQPPPPGPNPPPPNPAPKGFRVIFVYETSAPITPAMQQVMFGEDVRAYLDAKTVAGAGGTGWRRWDKDVVATNEKDADLKALWAAARPVVTVVPCVVIATDGKAVIEPFPADKDAALTLFKKYGGN